MEKRSSPMMTATEEKQVAFWIDGYYSVCPSDPERKTAEGAFEAAKRELVENFNRHLEAIGLMTFDRFMKIQHDDSDAGMYYYCDDKPAPPSIRSVTAVILMHDQEGKTTVDPRGVELPESVPVKRRGAIVGKASGFGFNKYGDIMATLDFDKDVRGDLCAAISVAIRQMDGTRIKRSVLNSVSLVEDDEIDTPLLANGVVLKYGGSDGRLG